MLNVSILGYGSFGIAMALTAERAGNAVTLWGRNPDVIKHINEHRHSPTYLEGVPIPKSISVTASLKEACQNADVILYALPGQLLRSFFLENKVLFPVRTPILITSKSLEKASGLLPSEILEEIHVKNPLGFLGGAHFAVEVAEGLKTLGLIATASSSSEGTFKKVLFSSTFDVDTTPDIHGVQAANALKNIVAIKSGLASYSGKNGMALATGEGFSAMLTVGASLGASTKTFLHPALLGDFIATTQSEASRNFRFGKMLGEGQRFQDALCALTTVEGCFALQGLLARCEKALPEYFVDLAQKVFLFR